MTSNNQCYVYIVLPNTTEFVTAGRFQISQTRTGIKLGQFVYGKKYLANENAIPIDPVELKFGQTHYETTRMEGFFGAIRDAMPDFWGRQIIERSAKKYLLNEFDYLRYGPDDRAGALGFGLGVEPPAPRKQFSRALDLKFLQKTADMILRSDTKAIDNEIDTNQVKQLLLEGTSMGGARPKAVIEDENTLWIAKFSSPKDKWDQPLVEHAFLNLARKCGLIVSESKIISVGGKNVLLVRRFDRDKVKTGYHRHRMISALTLLKSEESPLARENWSYLLLADELRRISAKPELDLRELYARMCFNAIVSNFDDHPRNHAILARHDNWRLSPAYDLTPSPIIAEESRFLAMTCGVEGRLAQKKNLLSACERFFLSAQEAENIIQLLVKTIKNEWENQLRRAGVTPKDCAIISNAFNINLWN